MDCSTSGFTILHYLPDIAQIHVHSVGDTSQPSQSLPPSSNLLCTRLQKNMSQDFKLIVSEAPLTP